MERYRHTGEEPSNWKQVVNKADKDLGVLPAGCYWKGTLTDLSEQEKEHVMNAQTVYLTLFKERAVWKDTDRLSDFPPERATQVVTPNPAMFKVVSYSSRISIAATSRTRFSHLYDSFFDKSVPSRKVRQEGQFRLSKTPPFSFTKDEDKVIEWSKRPASEEEFPDLSQPQKLKGDDDITRVTEWQRAFTNNKPPIFDQPRETERRRKESRAELKTEIEEDINYQAFLRDAESLKREFAGYMVAYADGKKVSIGRNVDELLARLAPDYTTRPLFIKDIPEKPVKFRRPMRIPRS